MFELSVCFKCKYESALFQGFAGWPRVELVQSSLLQDKVPAHSQDSTSKFLLSCLCAPVSCINGMSVFRTVRPILSP